MTEPLKLIRSLSLLVVAALFTSVSVEAQQTIELDGDPVLVASSDVTPYMQPRWSPVDKSLIVTGPGYQGLWRVAEDGSVMELTDERAAGFGIAWSPDGSHVVSRIARYENQRRLNAVAAFNVETTEQIALTSYAPGIPGQPRWLADSLLVLARPGQPVVLDLDGNLIDVDLQQDVVIAEGARIISSTRGSEDEIMRSESGRDLLNLTSTADGTMIAFEEMGGNLFMARADGSGMVDLGQGYRPRWSPDGEWLLYMVTEDDGHNFTSSELFAARASDGKVVQLTSTPDVLEMNPDWSFDGRSIAYDNDQGDIYVVSISTQ